MSQPNRIEDIIVRRDQTLDPSVGYAFAERPTWNDVDYLLSIVQGADERVRSLYDEKAPLSVFRDEVLAAISGKR